MSSLPARRDSSSPRASGAGVVHRKPTSNQKNTKMPTLSTLDSAGLDEDEVTIMGTGVISKDEFKKVMFSYVMLVFLFSTTNSVIYIIVDVLDTNGTWTSAAATAVGLAAVYAFLVLTTGIVLFCF